MRNLIYTLTSLRAIAALTVVAPALALALAAPLTPRVVLIISSALSLLLTLAFGSRLRAQHAASLRAVEDVADCRRLLEETRTNVGKIANAVYELRTTIEGPAMSADRLWECMNVLGGRIDEQSDNLGAVAGGLDALRRASADAFAGAGRR